MAAIADLSALINRLTGGNAGVPEFFTIFKDNRVGAAAAVAPVAARMTSLWQYNGYPSDGALPPTTAAVPTNATDGGLKQTDPTTGKEKWLVGAYGAANAAGLLILYDRLLHISGLSGTVTTAQTVGGTLLRYETAALSVGNEIWVEVYTQIGATGTTITASYTNQAGTAGRTTRATAIGGTGLREAQRIIPLPLQQGDTGVQAVASVTVLATTGVAGDFGVSIVRPLVAIPIPAAGLGTVRSLASGLPPFEKILTDACLAWAWWANTTTIPQVYAGLTFVDA